MSLSHCCAGPYLKQCSRSVINDPPCNLGRTVGLTYVLLKKCRGIFQNHGWSDDDTAHLKNGTPAAQLTPDTRLGRKQMAVPSELLTLLHAAPGYPLPGRSPFQASASLLSLASLTQWPETTGSKGSCGRGVDSVWRSTGKKAQTSLLKSWLVPLAARKWPDIKGVSG